MKEKIVVDIEQLKARLNSNINDIEAAIALGNVYYDQGDAGLAVLYYRHTLDLDPKLANVRTDMGAMYWRSGNVSLAEQAFREAIAHDPNFGHAYVNLGYLLHQAKNNLTEARAAWQQLVTINPDHEVTGKARELLRETAMKLS